MILFDHTYSCNQAALASWSQRGSSAPGAKILPWQPPSGAPGKSVSAAWNRCMQTRGAGHLKLIIDTWVQDTWRGLPLGAVKRVLGDGDLGYSAWGLFQSEVVRPAEMECPHGGRRLGCPLGCHCWDRGRGLGCPGLSHRQAGRRFWSFSISPWWLHEGRLQSLKETNVQRFAGAHLCRASARLERSLFHSQTHLLFVFSKVQTERVTTDVIGLLFKK